MRIFWLSDVDKGFELVRAEVDDVYVVFPFGLLEDILEEKELESVHK